MGSLYRSLNTNYPECWYLLISSLINQVRVCLLWKESKLEILQIILTKPMKTTKKGFSRRVSPICKNKMLMQFLIGFRSWGKFDILEGMINFDYYLFSRRILARPWSSSQAHFGKRLQAPHHSQGLRQQDLHGGVRLFQGFVRMLYVMTKGIW